MKFGVALLVLITLLSSSQNFKQIQSLYENAQYKEAFNGFSHLAKEDSDLEAAHMLAVMYENGEGCVLDLAKAMQWYKVSSTGYYSKSSYNTTREIEKKQIKLYKSLKMPEDKETAETIKRHTQSLYNLKVYKTNYFLPVSYRENGKYAPTNGHKAQSIETEFQLSIKYDFAADIFGWDEIYTVAYTQLSFWQLYTDSAYFRETNYNPELMMALPFSSIYENDYVKAIKFSFAHQSNGRGGLEERSWNSLNASFHFQYKSLFTELKLWKRLNDPTDYNPDLIDYMGSGHIDFSLPYKKHMFGLLLRNNFSGKSATKIDYSYPVFGKEDLFLYIKYFNGYGESLIDYNHNVNKIGIGFSISR